MTWISKKCSSVLDSTLQKANIFMIAYLCSSYLETRKNTVQLQMIGKQAPEISKEWGMVTLRFGVGFLAFLHVQDYDMLFICLDPSQTPHCTIRWQSWGTLFLLEEKSHSSECQASWHLTCLRLRLPLSFTIWTLTRILILSGTCFTCFP